MEDLWDAIVWSIVLGATIYALYLSVKAHRVINASEMIAFTVRDALQPFTFIDKDGDPHLDVIAIARGAVIDTLAHLGASNLTELGYKKEQVKILTGQIKMAKNGIRVAGDMFGQGAGINDIISGFAGGDQGQAQGGIMQLIQLAQAFGFDVGGMMKGVLPGGQAGETKPKGAPQGTGHY